MICALLPLQCRRQNGMMEMNRKGVFHMAKKTKTQPKARKTITSNNLADLSKLVQALEIDDENPENQKKPSLLDKKIIYNEFQNSTYTLVSPMAYLIGIDKENFDEENARLFLLKSYEKLDAHKEARIIRNLCRIRTAMERNDSPSESCRSAHRPCLRYWMDHS